MTDTYEFLKAQKDAIIAKQEADENEWLKAAAEDIAHYKQERDLALAECERLRADAERYQWLRNSADAADWEHLGHQLLHVIDATIDAARAKS